MTTAASARFWICPQCQRHVPVRIEACRCGATRPPDFVTSAPVTPPPAAPALATPAAPGGLVYPNEAPLFAVALVLSGLFWLLLLVGTLGLVLVYVAMFFVFYLFAQSALIAYIKGTAVKLTPQQFPDLHARLVACCERLGVTPVPDTYLLHGDGAFNAFATRFLGTHFVVLYSDIVDALESQPGAVNFYLGHELGHIHRRHLLWQPVLMPAGILPLLGAAYHRAREATCDNYGAACCDDPADAVAGLTALAAGSRRWRQLSVPEYEAQAMETGGFWMSFNELISDYPWLVKRVARVIARAERQPARIPPRNPLAYLFAAFVPRTGAGAGGGLAGLLMVVAIIGIIAAIAIPSLLRARVAANETAAASDVRAVASAQAAYAGVAGGYATLDCLAAPSSPGCLRNYPANGPTFITPDLARLDSARGYERTFMAGEVGVDGRVREFCYAAYPMVPNRTGVRSFATDGSGRVCVDRDGANLCEGSALPAGCTPLR